MMSTRNILIPGVLTDQPFCEEDPNKLTCIGTALLDKYYRFDPLTKLNPPTEKHFLLNFAITSRHQHYMVIFPMANDYCVQTLYWNPPAKFYISVNIPAYQIMDYLHMYHYQYQDDVIEITTIPIQKISNICILNWHQMNMIFQKWIES